MDVSSNDREAPVREQAGVQIAQANRPAHPAGQRIRREAGLERLSECIKLDQEVFEEVLEEVALWAAL